jgi:hypothetical protein
MFCKHNALASTGRLRPSHNIWEKVLDRQQHLVIYTPSGFNIHGAEITPYPKVPDMLHTLEKMPAAAFFRRFKPTKL